MRKLRRDVRLTLLHEVEHVLPLAELIPGGAQTFPTDSTPEGALHREYIARADRHTGVVHYTRRAQYRARRLASVPMGDTWTHGTTTTFYPRAA